MTFWKKQTAWVLVGLTLMNTSLFSTRAMAADHTAELRAAVKTLQTGIDSGKTKPEDGVDVFSKTLLDKGISVEDVDGYVRARLNDTEYASFQNQINTSLRGIDPTSLRPEEMGEIVGRALSNVRAEGLYWSGCAQVWTGAAVIAAAVVTGIIAIIKSKSDTSIRKDWEKKIADQTTTYNGQIDGTRNWQTSIPNSIASYQNEIAYAQQQQQYYQQQYYNAQDQASQQQALNALRQLDQLINNDNAAIQTLIALFIKYTADPSSAEVDAVALQVARDAALADLASQESVALAKSPSNQAVGKKLGIGAGIGAAIGAGLLIHGIHDGAHCGG